MEAVFKNSDFMIVQKLKFRKALQNLKLSLHPFKTFEMCHREKNRT